MLDAATEVQKRNFSDTAENDKQIHRIHNATSMLAFRNQKYPRSALESQKMSQSQLRNRLLTKQLAHFQQDLTF